MRRDLRRRMMGEKTSDTVFSLAPKSTSEIREDGAAIMRSGANGAINFTVNAVRDAVYRIHVHHDGATFPIPANASSHPYSFLQNETFPTYVSAIKSGDAEISFYLPLQKGDNTLRFWTERDDLFVHGVTVSSASIGVASGPARYYPVVVIHGWKMLDFTEAKKWTDMYGWNGERRSFMLRAKSTKKDGEIVVESDTLSVNDDTLATIPAGHYRVGLCCAVVANGQLTIECGSATAMVSVKSDTNTSTGAAYVDTGVVVEDVASNGLSIKIGDGGGWANIGAIVLQKIPMF